MNVSNPADRALSISVLRIPKTNCHACLYLSLTEFLDTYTLAAASL